MSKINFDNTEEFKPKFDKKMEEEMKIGDINNIPKAVDEGLSLTAQVLLDPDTCGFIRRIEKAKMLEFVNNNIGIQKTVAYKQFSVTQIQNMIESFYGQGTAESEVVRGNIVPSTPKSIGDNTNVKSILAVTLNESVLRIQREPAKNVVQLAEQMTAKEAEGLILEVDIAGLFDKRYAIPYEHDNITKSVTFYISTVAAIDAYLKLDPQFRAENYSITVTEYENAFYVNFVRENI